MERRRRNFGIICIAVLLLPLASCRPAKEGAEKQAPGRERYIPVEANAVNMLYVPETYIPESGEPEKKEGEK